MQRIDTSRRRRPAGDGPARGYRQSAALHSIGTPSARRITTLALAFGQALPTLDTVPTEYNHEVNVELLYDLGAALVKAGLGSPETWQRCGGNAVVFAQHSIMSGIGAQRGDLLQRNVEFHLRVSDVLERDGYDSTLSNGQLAVTIECGGSGYLKIGPALNALEEQAEGLGAAFYWTLIHYILHVLAMSFGVAEMWVNGKDESSALEKPTVCGCPDLMSSKRIDRINLKLRTLFTRKVEFSSSFRYERMQAPSKGFILDLGHRLSADSLVRDACERTKSASALLHDERKRLSCRHFARDCLHCEGVLPGRRNRRTSGGWTRGRAAAVAATAQDEARRKNK
jgi:hypothetical protein